MPRTRTGSTRKLQPVTSIDSKRAETITMPLLIQHAPHALLAHGGLDPLRKAFKVKYRKANEAVLMGLAYLLIGPLDKERNKYGRRVA